jgi:threonylcarbamoyladenosine tRNA methylthiotransferase MtaB
MRRRWGARRYLDRCRLVQQSLDGPAITTDIIVGFPGETDAEFEQTCDLAREVGFSKIHIFPFSARRGTPAADMAQQIPGDVKRQRAAALAQLETQLRQRYFQSLRGRQLRVLIEAASAPAATTLIGTSCRYAPVEIDGPMSLIGRFVDVTAGDVVDGHLRGERNGTVQGGAVDSRER